jgi:hypothetical protein
VYWLAPEHAVGCHRLVLPLHGEIADERTLEVVAHRMIRVLRKVHGARLGNLFEARAEVRGVADGRVVHREVVADSADDDEPRVQSHAVADLDAILYLYFRRVLGQRTLHVEGGGHGAAGGVLVRNRCAEEGHQTVTEKVAHRTLVSVNRRDHSSNPSLRERVDHLRIESPPDSGRAGGVGEQHRHGAPLAL